MWLSRAKFYRSQTVKRQKVEILKPRTLIFEHDIKNERISIDRELYPATWDGERQEKLEKKKLIWNFHGQTRYQNGQ